MSDHHDPGDDTQPATAPHRTFVDLSPLRISPAFRRLWLGQAISGIGAWLTTTAVSLEIFHITGNTFMVSLVGGISLIPMIAAGLWGGMLIDAFDRRTIAIVTAVLAWLSTLSLLALAIWDTAVEGGGGHAEVWPFYLVTTIQSVAATITQAARSAIIPRIVPTDYVSRANALNGIAFGLQLTIGPALAGILIAALGYPITYAIDAVMFTAAFVGIFTLPKLPPLENVTRPGLASLLEGFRFLGRSPNIRMSFIVDLVAMSFGRPQVVFPAIAVGSLTGGAIGGGSVSVGILTASMAVGTFLAGLFSGPVARVHRHGVAVTWAVIGFGGFTVLLGLVIGAAQLGWFGTFGDDFGAVGWVPLVLAFVMLVGTGVTDQVSAIFRSTILLTAAPDEMRGRMQGVFVVVVTGGPRLGDLFAGIVSTLIGLWAPSLIGGVVIVALVWLLARATPAWRAYDARHPTP